jgi:hypothetical protein
MTKEWINSTLALATVLLASLALATCAPDRQTAPTGLSDPSSENTQSVPYEAWFKDRPQ